MGIYDSINYRLDKARQLRWLRKKQSYQSKQDMGAPHHVFWIFGCQRSGTTFMENIFRQDRNSAVFGEFSELSIGERRTGLRPAEELVKAIQGLNAHYAVIRPLFESDRMEELLAIFPSSSAIWLYRNSDEVVRSMLRKWQDGFFGISKEVEQDTKGHWRLEALADRIREQYTETTEQYMAYWMERNRLILGTYAQQADRILLLDYERFIQDPYGILQQEIQRRTGTDLSVPASLRFKVKERIANPTPLQVDPALRTAADQLYQQLKDLTA